ncbi:MAG: hypothetical protein PHV59_05265 [Victivallales bacterium]|nr:hypothetical protein [Victivallales bacterium]
MMTNEKTNKKSKAVLICGISVASIVLLMMIISAFNAPAPPDPKELSPRTKVAYMATREFAKLPKAQKMKYMADVRPSPQVFRQLSEKERRAVFRNTGKIMHQKMKERVNKFFKMTPEEQNRFLDEMIAERERHRQEMEARRAQDGSGSNNGGGPPPGNHKAMMQGMLENTDSTTRAQMNELHKRMEARRKETGK